MKGLSQLASSSDHKQVLGTWVSSTLSCLLKEINRPMNHSIIDAEWEKLLQKEKEQPSLLQQGRRGSN